MRQDHNDILPAVVGQDHASLALMPFVATREPDGRDKPRTFAYQVRIDERLRRFRYTLVPGEGQQLPTQYDQPILLALLQLWLNRDPEARMDFDRRDVFDLLRWSDSGTYYERLDAALLRITEMTIRIETAMVARDGREYSKGRGAAHIIDRYHISDSRGEPSFVVWGDIIREGRQLDDFKRLDWDLLLTLSDPISAQLYRLIDRAVLSGQSDWEVGWRTLASLLGMSPDAYNRPAKFKARLQPRFEELIQQGVIDSVGYERGGTFVFNVPNYLRGEIRRVLLQFEVFEDAARQLLAGYDETAIMRQCDCLMYGSRPKPEKRGGYLVQAVREDFELRYADDEPEAFLGIWSMISEQERTGYHEAALRLCGARDDLFATREDPTAWPIELRAVARFMICHSIDADEVNRSGATGRIPQLP